tara:strand:- start:666 stop:842 length:177 start_codon:yes stop_codon:yes gene_type:complete
MFKLSIGFMTGLLAAGAIQAEGVTALPITVVALALAAASGTLLSLQGIRELRAEKAQG